MNTKLNTQKRRLSYESGDKYGFVVLTGNSYMDKNSQLKVEVKCECGKINWTGLSQLKTGATKSCGCLSAKNLHNGRYRHGLSRHKLYKLWSHMIDRCNNINSDAYHNYGARGIDVCNEWLDSEKFIRWAENHGWEFNSGLTLERIENSKGYYPNNCKWATRHEQSRNKRSNIYITLFGETKCVMDWSKDKRCSVAYNTISNRIKKLGWDEEKAVLTPPQK